MAKPDIICGIDIGNSSIKTVIAERSLSGPLKIIGVGSTTALGMRRGSISDIEETVKNIGTSVQLAQTMAGTVVRRAYVALNGPHMKSQVSHGVVAVARPDTEITHSDIARVTEAASTIHVPPNYEIVHILPRNFIIDSQEHVKNALGMKGVRLEADVLLIKGLTQHMRNLAKCVNDNDIEVENFIYGPLAAELSTLNKQQKEHGVLLIDIGGSVTNITIFHEGDLVYTAVLPIGSWHITSDLAVALRTSVDKAEVVKRIHGQVGTETIQKRDNIDLSEILEESDSVITRKELLKIIDARMGELFEMIAEEIKKAHPVSMLPAGIVLTGGGANLPGLVQFAKNHLKLSSRIGGDIIFDGLAAQINDPAFSVATGLVIYGARENNDNRSSKIFNDSSVGDKFKKLGKWLKNFIP